MAKKTNLKAEKAKRNKAYALLHKRKPAKSARPRPSFRPSGDRPEGEGMGSGPPREGRPSFSAICSSCGIQTTVPFEPVSGKPVYCQSCFQTAGRG